MYKWVCDSLNSAITQFGSSNYPDGSPSGARMLAAFFDSAPVHYFEKVPGHDDQVSAKCMAN